MERNLAGLSDLHISQYICYDPSIRPTSSLRFGGMMMARLQREST